MPNSMNQSSLIIIERKQKRPIVDFKSGNEEWGGIAPKS